MAAVADPRGDALPDALLELRGRLLGERERDDRLGGLAVGEQGGHPLRDDLCLARSGRRDDLDVAAAVRDGRRRLPLQAGDRVSYRPGVHDSYGK